MGLTDGFVLVIEVEEGFFAGDVVYDEGCGGAFVVGFHECSG